MNIWANSYAYLKELMHTLISLKKPKVYVKKGIYQPDIEVVLKEGKKKFDK